jgi:hypothetical protein
MAECIREGMAMNKSRVIGMALAIGCFSGSASAGEAKVVWQDTDSYTDIRSGNQSIKSMRSGIEKSIGGEFSELAGQLPAGYVLDVTVTDLDLAGEVDPIPTRSVDQVRVLKDIYFPRMTFDYRLTGSDGAVLLAEQKVELKDMQYLSNMRVTRTSEAFYSERRMVRDWFSKQLLPQVKR